MAPRSSREPSLNLPVGNGVEEDNLNSWKNKSIKRIAHWQGASQKLFGGMLNSGLAIDHYKRLRRDLKKEMQVGSRWLANTVYQEKIPLCCP